MKLLNTLLMFTVMSLFLLPGGFSAFAGGMYLKELPDNSYLVPLKDFEIPVFGTYFYQGEQFKYDEFDQDMNHFPRCHLVVQSGPGGKFSKENPLRILEIDSIKTETGIYGTLLKFRKGFKSDYLNCLTRDDDPVMEDLIEAMGDFITVEIKK